MARQTSVVVHTRQTTWGGGEVLLADLVEHLRTLGRSVQVKAPDGSEVLKRLSSEPVRMYRNKRTIHIFNDFGSVWRNAWPVARSARSVFICHGWWQTSPARNAICRALGVDMAAVSSAVQAAVIKNGFYRDVPILPIGPADKFRVPTEAQVSAARECLGLDHEGAGSQVLVWVGRFQEIKRPKLFVQLVAQMPETVSGLMVVPAYARSREESVVRRQLMAAAASESRVRVLPGADPLTAYMAADVVVSTSEFESLGIAMMEAMACGLACVTTASGGPKDFVRGKAGRVLASTTSIGALSDATRQLLELSPMERRHAASAAIGQRGIGEVADLLMRSS